MKIKNVDDHKFRTDATLEALCRDAKPINEWVMNGNYRIEGAKNSLELYFGDNSGSELYSVFCRFDKPNELTGATGKCNVFFGMEYSAIEAANEFGKTLRNMLKYLN